MPMESVKNAWLRAALQMGRKPFSDAGEGKGVHDKDKQDGEEADHQELHKTLNAVLQAEEADKGANGHRDGHARYLKPRILGHGSKELSHRGRRHAHECPLHHVHAVNEHPPGDGRIEHEEQVASRKSNPAEFVPVCALRLKNLQGEPHIAP